VIRDLHPDDRAELRRADPDPSVVWRWVRWLQATKRQITTRQIEIIATAPRCIHRSRGGHHAGGRHG
jgi:hypothetical protein